MIATLFCLDTSFLNNGWWKRYRRDVFPTLWEEIDKLLYAGNVFSCREVFDDLKKQRDPLLVWATQRKQFFFEPDDQVIANMQHIMGHFPNFAAESGHANASDPWVIAEAMSRGAIVVTDEVSAPNRRASKPPKIPDVCNALKVGWASPIDFLAEAGIRL